MADERMIAHLTNSISKLIKIVRMLFDLGSSHFLTPYDGAAPENASRSETVWPLSDLPVNPNFNTSYGLSASLNGLILVLRGAARI